MLARNNLAILQIRKLEIKNKFRKDFMYISILNFPFINKILVRVYINLLYNKKREELF